jgi:hypothetical protein
MSHFERAAERYNERKHRRRILSRSRIRTRCGSWRTFERRFVPLPAPNHDVFWELRGEVPSDAEAHYWWTVLDCEGHLILSPGFRFVNRYAFVRCAVPWTEVDEGQPEYRFD